MPGTGEALPESIEERVYAIHFDAPTERRSAEIDALCQEHPDHDAAIRKRVRSLRRSDSMLGQVSGDLQDTLAGERIGSFTVKSVLGEGGFGTVYLAEQQEPVRRQVALKVLQAGRGDTRSRQRFEDERQLLARLQHACIAQVYDAGVTADRVHYFAMEFVDGRPITDWCDGHRLGLDARLQLFTRICGAIHHAHQRGIVHRDLKPSNVLVREEDGQPLPKVIDFGIAKLLEAGEEPRHANTIQGGLVGTPGYMSPEQAAGEAVDTRTDVYSLGVLLCELLTAKLPVSRELLADASLARVARALAEATPRRPSELVAGTDLERSAGLRARLREDLDWIVLRAVAPDREARYSSVAALADDVERHLRGEPVGARRHATSYLLRKLLRKHRVAATVALLVLGSLFAAIASLAWGLSTAHQLRDEAEDRERASRIAVAQLSLNDGDANTARTYLESVPAAERGWEWRHLASVLDTSTSALPAPPNVLDLVWLDDRRVVSLARLDPPEVWDVVAGERLGTLPIEGTFRRICYDRATGVAVTAHDEGWSMWHLADGRRLAPLRPVPTEPLGLAWSEDRSRIAMSGKSGWLWLIDAAAEDATILRKQQLRCDSIRLAFHGDRLLIGYENGDIEATDAATGKVHWTAHGHADHVDDLLVDRARDVLYSASIDGTVRAWRLADGEPIVALTGDVRMRRLALSRDGARLYACGGWAASRMMAWDTDSFRLIGSFHGHRFGVRTMALSPDGERIVTAARDDTVRTWNATPKHRHVRLDAGYDARRLSASLDGRRFGTASFRGRVSVWNAHTLQPELQLETGQVWTGNAMDDQRIYVCGSVDGEAVVRAYDIDSGEVRAEGTTGSLRIESMLVDPQQRWLIGGHGEHLLIWRLPSLELLHQLDLPVYACRLTWDPRTVQFVVGGDHSTVSWIDPARGRVARKVVVDQTVGPIGALALHGDTLVMGISRRMFLTRDGDPFLEVATANSCAMISPDGTRLITGGADCVVRTWDLRTGDPLLSLSEPEYSVTNVRLVDDGRRILGLAHRWSAPSYIYVWSAPDEVPLGR
jgi:serine/threonine protein kinase/WD40 repeat protein